MKKKLIICIVVIALILLTASIGFAGDAYGRSFQKAFSVGPYYVSTSMHVEDACTSCYVVSTGAATYHRSFIIDASFNTCSAILNVYGGQTKNIYCDDGGYNRYLRIQSHSPYYGVSDLYTSGTASVHYNP